jgi:hypothetical protein
MRLSNDSWIDGYSHIFGTLQCRDIFKSINFLLAHQPFQVHLDFEPVHLADSEDFRICRKMYMGNWWWNTQNQLPTQVKIEPVVCASESTHLNKVSGDQHAWPLDLTIRNIRKGIVRTP